MGGFCRRRPAGHRRPGRTPPAAGRRDRPDQRGRGKPTLAIDLPSGLDCDTGQPARHTIRAAQTCTFVAAKPGFFAPGAEHFTGRVHVLDIGAPRKLVEEEIGIP